MTHAKKRTAVLISGRGSNMMSLVTAARTADYPAEIVTVISNRPNAAGIAWAAAQGIATRVIDHKAYPSRDAFEAELENALSQSGAEIVALAGFMRLMTPAFVARWQTRMINIHPSLLPNFKGLHTHEQAIAAGVKIAGCTVHYVRAEMDSGPIIAQAAVPVLSGDTAAELGARVLAAEHVLYPAALRLVALGRTQVKNEKVILSEDVNDSPPLFSPNA
ncbi:MAG TPA: phosphoribosylglycinamide formyltransferase [Hyphomicrobium sp.]|nr:phosphoribosylglycinamide formyltransferase [Hyphomicrobium sp.]